MEGGWSGCGGWVEWLWRVGRVVVEGGWSGCGGWVEWLSPP